MDQLNTEAIKLSPGSEQARAWIAKVYAQFPQTWQNNHVMPLGGTGDDQQFAMFELEPSRSKRDAVEVKWFQAYPMRQGVGSRAMRELQRLAQEDGIALTLYPWDKGQVSQAKLTKFYKNTGFLPTAKGAKTMAWEPSVDEAKMNIDRKYAAMKKAQGGPPMPHPYSYRPVNLNGVPVQFSKHFWDRFLDPTRRDQSIEQDWVSVYLMLVQALTMNRSEVDNMDPNVETTLKKVSTMDPKDKGTIGVGLKWANDRNSYNKKVLRVTTWHNELEPKPNTIRVYEDLAEGLTHKDPVEKWVAVFKASKHPKFAGKTPEQREKMARTAQYRAVQNKKTFENMDHSKDAQAVPELKAALLSRKRMIKKQADDKDAVYDIINGLMTSVAKAHGISGQKLHDLWVDQYGEIPDTWILHESALPGSHTPTEAVLAKQYTVGVSEIKRQLKKGIKVELEHTTDRGIAREIALDHLGENLYYYDQLKQAGLEESTVEEAWLDMNEYGGWITPNRKVEYVDYEGHENHLRREHGLRLAQAFLDGYVRFQTNAKTSTFSIEGMLPALRKTYRIWGPTALNARNVYVDIFQWDDDMTEQGLTPHMMFRPGEGDKPQIINSFGVKTQEPIAEAKKRKAKTIIDGMIKSLIKQGRTRDEAIADLKKQVDSRFYEQIDAAAAMITEDDHSDEMDQLVEDIDGMFHDGFPFDALEAMEDARATVNDDPRLKALFDDHRADLADLLTDELHANLFDYGLMNQIADMIESVGIRMPDRQISNILDRKSHFINSLVSKNLVHAGISEVVMALEALENWGLHYYLEDFVDLEDGKDDVIRDLLKLYKAGLAREVAKIVKRLREEDVDWPELAAIEKSLGAGKITETREAAYKWLKSYLPTWPDYVLRDWMYNHFRGDWDASGDDPQTVIQRTLDGEGMTPQTRWKFVPNFHFTFDSLDPDTVRRIKERQGGAVNPYGIPQDAERHATQATLAAQQGGVRDEPVILKKVGNQYELIEGWHRTIQHFKQFPNGYKGPAWIALDAKPVSENFADGKGPGRKGDSQRHGIPKGATMAQLEKAAKASGRKGQLARWQLNMRRGRKKAHESEEMTADQWQALRKEDPRSYLGIKDYRNRKWWESHFKAAMAQARVKGQSHFEFPPNTKMYYMVTKNPLEEGGGPPHGTPENELAMMKAGTKPAVTFLDMGQYEEMYEPNMEHYGWIKQKWRLPNMDVNYYVIGQPGQEARVKRIGQLIYDMNKNGQNPTADYHRELGRLLGYSEADINRFLKDLEDAA